MTERKLKLRIDESQAQNKKQLARRRWSLLAKALKSPVTSEPSSPTDEFSLRRISTFQLFTAERVDLPASLSYEKNRELFRYSSTKNGILYYIDIGHLNRNTTAFDLIGFNNSGNVCIWPSEEALSHYILKNLSICCNKSVLELGGGMSCLAGLIAAKYSSPSFVLLTDGNEISIENVCFNIKVNTLNSTAVAATFKWGPKKVYENPFDVILCADCLFFDECRIDLIEALKVNMDDKGITLLTAPRRSGTLATFIKEAEYRGLHCRKLYFYDIDIWEKHFNLFKMKEYDPDIHYPILIIVTKVVPTSKPVCFYFVCCLENILKTYHNSFNLFYSCRADYWKSNAKKYCEFCKCWITDNKPSVEFHEKGRKHKENVQKHIKAVGRKSRRDQNETIRTDLALKKIESAALSAYKKDIASNPDLTSRLIAEAKSQASSSGEAGTESLWYETKTGSSVFYINKLTNEKVWTKPAEGYVSIQQQQLLAEEQTKQQLKELEKFRKRENLVKLQEQRQQEEEERAAAEREKLKAFRVAEEPVERKPYEPVDPYDPSKPYGQWKTVDVKPQHLIDFQLPQQEYVAIHVPSTLEPEPVREFKEKTVSTLKTETEVPAVFKKRKFGGNASRSIRQRLDDD